MPQHFVASPQWEWYIVWYFFLGGLAGGAYVIGTLLRLFGDQRDAGVARLAFLISFPAVVVCPILLTLDLGRPSRFWHMLFDSQTFAPHLKYWSPMSVGAWVLLVFSGFAAISFLEALSQGNGLGRLLSGGFGKLFTAVGALFGLSLAGYTGVLLSVTNQPIWSDTWALGGLFLASGLSISAAVLALFAGWRADEGTTEAKLSRADGYFLLLEIALLVVVFVTLGAVGGSLVQGRLAPLWILVAAGVLVPLAIRFRSSPERRASLILASALVVLGGFALRVIVVFSAQL